jgi:DNA-binding CsgD family transcriptional regulator
MERRKHVLNDVWEDYKREIAIDLVQVNPISLERIIADLFMVGEFYYYLLNIGDSSIENPHENLLKLHGLAQLPQHLNEIIALVHPEDLPFVLDAERTVLDKLKEIGWEHKSNLKSSYCFRMRVANGSYELFHHQALCVSESEDGRMVKAINIHTNINHITSVNNYSVLVSGISPRDDFYQISLVPAPSTQLGPPQHLSRRELEVLKLITQGFSSSEISNLLFLSPFTVRTHRKNILRKTATRNSSELVRKCITWGLI